MIVTPPDLEMWLCGYLRAVLGPDVQVSNKEPSELSTPLTRPLVVIRDDSGAKQSAVTFDRSVGVSVLAGTKRNDLPANTLARRVMGILTETPRICQASGSPIAAVVDGGCNGPYAVQEDQDLARRYSTVEYVVVGDF